MSSRDACLQPASWRLQPALAQTAAIQQTTIIRRMAPEIVAHRGDAEHFPENSLPALEAAWRRGLRYAELDVQVSADGVPFVIHDATLDRTTRASGDLRFMNADQLDGVDAGEPARFGRRHVGTELPRLATVAALMRGLPEARAFVEMKRASLAQHGKAACMESVLDAIAPVADRCVVISFDVEACRLARAAGLAIGWVLDHDPQDRRGDLAELRPEFVFCDHRRLFADAALPPGGWTWVSYEVAEAGLALALAGRGVAMVESMAPFRLAADLAARARVRA